MDLQPGSTRPSRRILNARWRTLPYFTIVLALFTAIPPAQSQEQPRGSILTIVTDSSGNAVPQAEVSINDVSVAGVTGPEGRVELFRVPPGRRILRIRRLGYRERILSVDVGSSGRSEARAIMLPIAAVLERVVVRNSTEKPARLAGTGRFDEFYSRRARESGTFLTREDIDKRDPGRTIDLFHAIPGIRVTYRGITPLISFARCKTGVQYFIDGQRLNDGFTEITGLHPNQIEAIEIYHGLASVPPQFIPRPSDCAAVVIWTRYN